MTKNPELLFFTKWLQSPLTVASITPSSPQLARAMALSLPECEGLVIELGGGTGAITQALLQTGVDPNQLVVIERDPYFYRYLKKRFPEIKILCGDAMNLMSLINGMPAKLPIRTVVSGLPFLSMNAIAQKRLLEQLLSLSDSKGSFVQFSYALTSPLKKSVEKELQLESRCVARVWQNVPPAKVWVYKKKSVNNILSDNPGESKETILNVAR
ncbi:MAG: methyltransferase [Gammaproteobacteria bacterium]|nr:methyltransferase [Gammaproteobacteria bacterium]